MVDTSGANNSILFFIVRWILG